MKKHFYKAHSKLLLIGVMVFISLFLISFASASTYSDCSIYGNCKPVGTTSTSPTVNYSILNVNNSQYFQGYTPTTLGTWLQNTFNWITNNVNDLVNYYSKTDINNFNASYLNTTNTSYVPYTGANQNVDLGNNNLIVNGTTTFLNTIITGGLTVDGDIDLGDTYGSELIDQELWNTAGYWNGQWQSPPWTGDGVKLTSDGSTGGFAKVNFWTIGVTYRITVTIVLNSGTVSPFYDGYNPHYLLSSGEYTWDYTPNGVHLYGYSSSFNGEITAVSIKEIIPGSTAIPILNISNGKLYVSYAGKVGIGTTNPFTSLHVNGNILANGTINATSGLGVNGNSGITGNYTILKEVDLVGLTKTYCSMNFTGGILFSSTC